MTADEIEWRTYANETDTNRVENYSETHDYLDRRQQQSGSESIEDPLEILDHLWKSGTTPDSSIDATATGKHMPIDISNTGGECFSIVLPLWGLLKSSVQSGATTVVSYPVGR